VTFLGAALQHPSLTSVPDTEGVTGVIAELGLHVTPDFAAKFLAGLRSQDPCQPSAT
jgi:hypothetical protein